MKEQRRFSRGNLIFLFVAAFLAGAIAKRAFNEHLRIGFDDPQTIVTRGTLYDIDEAEQAVIEQSMSAEEVDAVR